MELLKVQNLGAAGHYATVPLNRATTRPLLLNAISVYSAMLVGVNSVFTIPIGLGTDRGCQLMPKQQQVNQ